MQTQNLPLGADCLKYLELTPKAPADIDKWMIDPPAANASDSILAVRTIEPSDVPQLNETLPIPTPGAQQLPSRKVLYAAAFVQGCFILILLFLIQRPPDALWRIFSWLDKHNKRVFGFEEFLRVRTGKRILIFIKLVLVTLLLLDIYSIVLLWNSQYLLESWSATSEFLETCKMQQVCVESSNQDCNKLISNRIWISHLGMIAENTWQRN
jgi:hypothetical protein